MASIINAFRNIISDSSWFLKTVLMAVPVFMVLNYSIGQGTGFDEKTMALFGAVLCIYIGCGTYMMNRNINNNSPILPNLLGLPELLFHSFFSMLIVIPGILACAFTLKMFSTYLSFDFNTMLIMYVLIIIFFSPFIFIPLVLYAVNGKIQEVFNFKSLFDGAGNFIVAIFTLVIQYVFTFAIVWFLAYKVFSEMMEDYLLINVINSFFIVLTF